MIKKTVYHRADGSIRTQVRVVQAYRPYPGHNPKQRTIRDFGCLEDQTDPDAFWAEVNACNETLKAQKTQSIAIPVGQRVDLAEPVTLNYGYKFISSCYNDLRINKCVCGCEKTLEILVADQILWGGVPKETIERINHYYGMEEYNVVPREFYRDLGVCGEKLLDIQWNLKANKIYSLSKKDGANDAFGVRVIGNEMKKGSTFYSTSLIMNDFLEPLFAIPICTEAKQDVPALLAKAKEISSSNHLIILCMDSVKKYIDADGIDVISICETGETDASFYNLSCARKIGCYSCLEDWDKEKGLRYIYILNDSDEDSLSQKIVTANDKIPLEGILTAYACYCSLVNSFQNINMDYNKKVSFINTETRVQGIFLAYLISSIIINMIQNCITDHKISAKQMGVSLRLANCIVLNKGGYIMLMSMAENQQAAADYALIQKAFGTDYYYAFSKQEVFRRFFADMKLRKV